jgi:hypothetical protein
LSIENGHDPMIICEAFLVTLGNQMLSLPLRIGGHRRTLDQDTYAATELVRADEYG